MKMRLVSLLILLITLFSVSTLSAQSETLIQPDDLVYRGAFRLPQDASDDIGWLYSGHAMTHYPGGDDGGPDDGYPGSLFATGHDWNQYVSEISIPVAVISNNVNDLNVARTLQDFSDLRGDLYDYLEMPHAALAYLPPQGEQSSSKLYFAWTEHLGMENFASSHGWSELDLSNPQTAGLWSIAGHEHYETVNYMFAIDPKWAAEYTAGMLLATGRFREGGQVGCGPALFAIAPWNEGNPPAPGTALPAITLLQYENFEAPDNKKLNDYHDADEWSGGEWLTVGGRSAVIFAGTKGLGEYWYGFANGVVHPEGGPYPEVPPYPYDNRGFWSTDYEAQILFYDPADLGAVARGEMEAWQPQPYAVLSIDDYLFGNEESPVQKQRRVGAIAFDVEHGLLYVFEPTAYEEAYSVIHVWQMME
jgi:hypothetical protein